MTAQQVRRLGIVSIVLLGAGGTAHAEFQSHALIASDYVIQGISQTLGEASLQGGVSYSHNSGAFGGVWLAENSYIPSRYQRDERVTEVDYYAGYTYRPDAGPSWQFVFTHYTYPDETYSADYRYDELAITADLNRNFSATAGFSRNLYDSDRTSRFYEVLYDKALGPATVLNVGVGYQDLDALYDRGYRYSNIGVSRLVGRFTFDLTYIDTDDNARELFGDRATDSRWVFSVTAAF